MSQSRINDWEAVINMRIIVVMDVDSIAVLSMAGINMRIIIVTDMNSIAVLSMAGINSLGAGFRYMRYIAKLFFG
jgi:hypothetical protein